MNVRCPICQSVFRVDPARVPAGGIRAKCSRCGNPFVLKPPAAASPAAPAPAGAPQATSATRAAPVATPPAAPRPAAPAATPPHAPTAPAAERPPQPGVPAATARPAATVSAGVPVFGSKDPDARAQRIARALVSDIVAYNRKKVDEALAAGTMRTEFREEIMKSWEEYVAQVGAERAKQTPHFRDALNQILARGQRVF